MDSLQSLLDTGIAEHRAPCAVLHAFRLNGPGFTLTAGRHTYDSPRAVQAGDLFDLASITKILATTALAMVFVQQGRLSLDASISRYLPERSRLEMPQPTIRQLLAHCGGLPACLPFHRDFADVPPGQARRDIVMATAAAYPPQTQTVYSDLGFMLLAFALERIGGEPLDCLAHRLIYEPLGMADTRFTPGPELRGRCVPTELVAGAEPAASWQGVVHDENARWLDGVAGHAGLFSTAADMGRFAAALLDSSGGFFAPDVVAAFIRPAGLVPGSSRCLGWDSPTQPGSSGGELLSGASFGHTGFTGTSFWADPVRKIAVILLTNAVHPTRDCKKSYFPWRNSVHTAAYRALNDC